MKTRIELFEEMADCMDMTAKELVMNAIEALPDNATLTDIREELEVIEGIEKGLADADAGRVVSHEEAVRRIESWTSR